jgi:hypothetical protein
MEDAYGSLFIAKGSIPTVVQNSKEAGATKDEEWEILDRKALGMI